MPNAKNLRKAARCFGVTGGIYHVDKAALSLDLKPLWVLLALIMRLILILSKHV